MSTYFAFLGGSGGFSCEEDLCEDHNHFNILPRMKISVEFARMIPHKKFNKQSPEMLNIF
jgi:hypothetical protein